jgi:hypothetical protein
MKVIESNTIYENPLPQLESKQSFFPFVCETKNGELFASIVIGQAFESVDSKTYKTISTDGGKSWSSPEVISDFSNLSRTLTDYSKVTALKNGDIALLGYAYYRDDPKLPIGNPENGGVLDDLVYYSVSKDGGKTFSLPKEIKCAWGPHVEASAPITELADGSFISPITGFPDWNGVDHGPMLGRALRSYDGGESWSDEVVSMDFGKKVTCYEQRMCQLESGTIVSIGWNEDVETGERLENHFTYSTDNGNSFSAPIPTGIRGQASSVCALGGERLLALHAVRRDTDKPGIYGYVIDFSDKSWRIVDKLLVWAPSVPVSKDTKMAEIFSFLKFGQPGAILLCDGDVMMTHWCAEDGRYRTVATRIRL